MSRISDEDVNLAMSRVRKNWVKGHDYDKSIRALGLLLLRCSPEMVSIVESQIHEAATRQRYEMLRKIRLTHEVK